MLWEPTRRAAEGSTEVILACGLVLLTSTACRALAGSGTSSVYSASPLTCASQVCPLSRSGKMLQEPLLDGTEASLQARPQRRQNASYTDMYSALVPCVACICAALHPPCQPVRAVLTVTLFATGKAFKPA